MRLSDDARYGTGLPLQMPSSRAAGAQGRQQQDTSAVISLLSLSTYLNVADGSPLVAAARQAKTDGNSAEATSRARPGITPNDENQLADQLGLGASFFNRDAWQDANEALVAQELYLGELSSTDELLSKWGGLKAAPRLQKRLAESVRGGDSRSVATGSFAGNNGAQANFSFTALNQLGGGSQLDWEAVDVDTSSKLQELRQALQDDGDKMQQLARLLQRVENTLQEVMVSGTLTNPGSQMLDALGRQITSDTTTEAAAGTNSANDSRRQGRENGPVRDKCDKVLYPGCRNIRLQSTRSALAPTPGQASGNVGCVDINPGLPSHCVVTRQQLELVRSSLRVVCGPGITKAAWKSLQWSLVEDAWFEYAAVYRHIPLGNLGAMPPAQLLQELGNQRKAIHGQITALNERLCDRIHAGDAGTLSFRTTDVHIGGGTTVDRRRSDRREPSVEGNRVLSHQAGSGQEFDQRSSQSPLLQAYYGNNEQPSSGTAFEDESSPVIHTIEALDGDSLLAEVRFGSMLGSPVQDPRWLSKSVPFPITNGPGGRHPDAADAERDWAEDNGGTAAIPPADPTHDTPEWARCIYALSYHRTDGAADLSRKRKALTAAWARTLLESCDTGGYASRADAERCINNMLRHTIHDLSSSIVLSTKAFVFFPTERCGSTNHTAAAALSTAEDDTVAASEPKSLTGGKKAKGSGHGAARNRLGRTPALLGVSLSSAFDLSFAGGDFQRYFSAVTGDFHTPEMGGVLASRFYRSFVLLLRGAAVQDCRTLVFGDMLDLAQMHVLEPECIRGVLGAYFDGLFAALDLVVVDNASHRRSAIKHVFISGDQVAMWVDAPFWDRLLSRRGSGCDTSSAYPFHVILYNADPLTTAYALACEQDGVGVILPAPMETTVFRRTSGLVRSSALNRTGLPSSAGPPQWCDFEAMSSVELLHANVAGDLPLSSIVDASDVDLCSNYFGSRPAAETMGYGVTAPSGSVVTQMPETVGASASPHEINSWIPAETPPGFADVRAAGC